MKKGVIRITRESKYHFPRLSDGESEMLTFLINNEGFIVRFKMREPRSSLLTLGKLAFGKAGIKPSCSAKISIIERNKIFNLEVL